MSDEYKFGSTIEPKKLKQVFALPGTEWSGALTAAEFGEGEANYLVKFILQGNPGRAFYYESKNGDIVASCVVTQHRALYKEAGSTVIGTVPDPELFGVNNITAIRISYVFVSDETRGSGLMKKLVTKAIEYTEAEILEKELARSSDRKDSFKLMVLDDKGVDQTLAKHYLGKKYVWFLYSAIDSVYSKFGFKSYPVEGYKIDGRIAESETVKTVEKLLSVENTQDLGKKLRLLDGTKKQDRDLIEQIFQAKQLELVTDLNKNVYHSELSGDQHSSLSLSNLASALRQSRPDSTLALGAITEQFKSTFLGTDAAEKSEEKKENDAKSPEVAPLATPRRKSSILLFKCSKFAILPDLHEVEHKLEGTRVTARKVGTEETQKYANYYGAVLTNELQKKSFYVLWMHMKGTEFAIVAMGEINHDVFPAYGSSTVRRRSSSFTGLNEMGGYNFQDLELLVGVAAYVAQKVAFVPGGGSVYVAVNDLPSGIPKPVLHDFFLHYLPKTHEPQAGIASANEETGELVQFHEDFNDFHTLPMLRKYGSDSGDFQLDWTANSLISWG